MLRTVLLSLLFLLPTLCALADDMTRAAQEALRARKLYYGEVDGNRGPETAEALRRFQEDRGFDPTGLLDETTLRALGLLPHAGLRAPAAERVEQSRDFIEDYLRACATGDLQAELAFYADRVDYFEDGPCDKAALSARLSEYRKNWPGRKFALIRCVGSPYQDRPDEMVVTFRRRFEVQGGGHEREGFEDLRVIIRSAGASLRIVSIQEA